MKILVTGCCGFIGYHLSIRLLNLNHEIIGVDNINNYYDIGLKKDRLTILKKNKKFFFSKLDISNFNLLNNLIKRKKIKYIVNLAAQAGVRYSISNPKPYFDSNILGFFNILESSRQNNIKHLIFASTSSVYGNNKNFPLKEHYNTENPLTFYAASKKSNEVFAHSYANIYALPSTCLRFFTVYGPFGRPDMALFKFVKNIFLNKKIDVYNKGKHTRDFTYIDDVVNGILSVLKKPSKNKIPYQVFNISSNKPIKLNNFIRFIEKNIGIKSQKNYINLQKGDILKTHGSNTKLAKYSSFNIKTKTEDGIKYFVEWFKNYYIK